MWVFAWGERTLTEVTVTEMASFSPFLQFDPTIANWLLRSRLCTKRGRLRETPRGLDAVADSGYQNYDEERDDADKQRSTRSWVLYAVQQRPYFRVDKFLQHGILLSVNLRNCSAKQGFSQS
jgi:hypothetical protein